MHACTRAPTARWLSTGGEVKFAKGLKGFPTELPDDSGLIEQWCWSTVREPHHNLYKSRWKRKFHCIFFQFFFFFPSDIVARCHLQPEQLSACKTMALLFTKPELDNCKTKNKRKGWGVQTILFHPPASGITNRHKGHATVPFSAPAHH